MKIVAGDLWAVPAEYRVITTNGVVNAEGCLVMGRGTAVQAARLFPNLSAKLGGYVSKYGNRCFVLHEEKLISFPTKSHWKLPSTMDLIVKSCHEIVQIADKYKINSIAMPKVGAGNGLLNWHKVQETIAALLDDRFTIVI